MGAHCWVDSLSELSLVVVINKKSVLTIGNTCTCCIVSLDLINSVLIKMK